MKRALLIVLDSVGVGYAPDADKYGDAGANTLGHIDESVGLHLPSLESIGLNEIRKGAYGAVVDTNWSGEGSVGWMVENSVGKDTISGHWEIAGAPVEKAFDVFEKFPDEMVSLIEKISGYHFIGNYPQSGTVVLEELGEEHIKTGKLILYTSADSVLQIAAHEQLVEVEELYRICRMAREVCDQTDYKIGRVIARPFVGEVGNFLRTANRKDFSFLPANTVLNLLEENQITVSGIGKISDIFAGQGITKSFPTKSNRSGMEKIDELWQAKQNGLIFVNLVDFDTKYGHRRDPQGYADCLLEFDTWLEGFLNKIEKDDLVMITADHGNDPTWTGTDHTREKVPLLVPGKLNLPRNLGERDSFSDVAATLADYFNLKKWPVGTSILT